MFHSRNSARPQLYALTVEWKGLFGIQINKDDEIHVGKKSENSLMLQRCKNANPCGHGCWQKRFQARNVHKKVELRIPKFPPRRVKFVPIYLLFANQSDFIVSSDELLVHSADDSNVVQHVRTSLDGIGSATSVSILFLFFTRTANYLDEGERKRDRESYVHRGRFVRAVGDLEQKRRCNLVAVVWRLKRE